MRGFLRFKRTGRGARPLCAGSSGELGQFPVQMPERRFQLFAANAFLPIAFGGSQFKRLMRRAWRDVGVDGATAVADDGVADPEEEGHVEHRRAAEDHTPYPARLSQVLA